MSSCLQDKADFTSQLLKLKSVFNVLNFVRGRHVVVRGRRGAVLFQIPLAVAGCSVVAALHRDDGVAPRRVQGASGTRSLDASIHLNNVVLQRLTAVHDEARQVLL